MMDAVTDAAPQARSVSATELYESVGRIAAECDAAAADAQRAEVLAIEAVGDPEKEASAAARADKRNAEAAAKRSQLERVRLRYVALASAEVTSGRESIGGLVDDFRSALKADSARFSADVAKAENELRIAQEVLDAATGREGARLARLREVDKLLFDGQAVLDRGRLDTAERVRLAHALTRCDAAARESASAELVELPHQFEAIALRARLKFALQFEPGSVGRLQAALERCEASIRPHAERRSAADADFESAKFEISELASLHRERSAAARTEARN